MIRREFSRQAHSRGASRLALLILIGSLGMSGAIGCRGEGLPWPCWDIPVGAVPERLGTHACRWQNAHAMRGEQDSFVIYEYEWHLDEARLAPFGERHILEIARNLDHLPFPIVIEASENRSLDEARRLALVQALASITEIGFDRVVIGYPAAEGLNGQEAPALAPAYLNAGSGGQFSTSGGQFSGGNAAGFGAGLGFGVGASAGRVGY